MERADTVAVSRERLNEGMTYEQFVAAMTKNQDRLRASEQATTIDEADLAFFRRLPAPLDVLVLAEDWCGDVIANLPVLEKLAQETGKLRPHIFLRDQNDDLMSQFLKDGQFKSIPVFVPFDAGMRELGRFIERPADFNTLRAQRRQELYATHPELGDPAAPVDSLTDEQRTARQTLLAQLEAELVPERVRMVVRDLRQMVEGAAG
jgi:hypothetical protein